MKLYEALTVLSRKGKGWFCYRNEDDCLWYSVFKFSEDMTELKETSIYHALTNCYWRTSSGNGWNQVGYNQRWCVHEYECSNDITDLWEYFFKTEAKSLNDKETYLKYTQQRLNCAYRKKVIDKDMLKSLEELAQKIWEETEHED